MENATVTLPFKVPELFWGFAEGKGLAKATASELILEFVIKDNFLSVFKSEVKELKVPQSEIEFVRLKQGWFFDTLLIRVKSMKWFADVPGADAELTLQLSREDRPQAAALVRILSNATDSAVDAQSRR